MAEDTNRSRLVTAPEFKKNVGIWMDSIIGISGKEYGVNHRYHTIRKYE